MIEKTNKRKKSFAFFKVIIVPFFIGYLFSIFVLQISTVSGPSMLPTYKNGEHVFVRKILNVYHRGDIIIAKKENTELIKRLVGLPGDVIEFKHDNLYVNQKKVKYYNYHGIKNNKYMEITLQKDEYLIIGDNFDISYDGREFGPIKKEQLIGKVIFKM